MMVQKEQLRADIQRRLLTLSSKDRAAESRSLCRRLKELVRMPLCAFAPMGDEPDILPLLQNLLREDGMLFLPRIEGEKMVFRRVKNLAELKRGEYGFREPPMSAVLDATACVLVPGRAFDAEGRRLGRGNGGYDHWIASQRKAYPETVFLGVCFECQLVQGVPVEAHDECVDRVVTARG